jgi:hypothetical protein
MRADVRHDRAEPCRGDAAPLDNRPSIARGPDGRGYEIMHVGHCEPLQLRRREGQGVGDRASVADKQAQRLGAVRNEMSRRIVEPPQQHCDLLARHPNTDEAHRRRAGYRDLGYVARCKERIAIPEHQFSVALTRRAASPDVDAEQKIVRAVCNDPARSDRMA